jgi:hypothetical protein
MLAKVASGIPHVNINRSLVVIAFECQTDERPKVDAVCKLS